MSTVCALSAIIAAARRAAAVELESRLQLFRCVQGFDACPVDQAEQGPRALGADAAALGLISKESYERNKGAYLHRVYVKHEATPEGGRLGEVAQNMGRRQRAKGGGQCRISAATP